MTESTASNLISAYTSDKVLSVAPILNKGFVNQVFLVETKQQKFIIRTDLDEASLDRFVKERWCMEAAAQVGVKTTKALEIGLIDGHPYMIMEYIDGISGEDAADKEQIWFTFGQYARKLHEIPVQGFGEHMAAAGSFDGSWHDFLEYNISSLTADDKVVAMGFMSYTESSQIKVAFESLRSTAIKFGLTHYDLRLGNTIVSTSGELYLIDWGSATVLPVPFYDFREILDESLADDSAEFAQFLSGYGMSITDYISIKPQLAIFSLLMTMDKLRWAIDKKKDMIPHFSKELRKRIEGLAVQ
jgi:aminoglycoside phosphotransferase (APT) family kinase protein